MLGKVGLRVKLFDDVLYPFWTDNEVSYTPLYIMYMVIEQETVLFHWVWQ